jgi:hypothetical protein
VITRKPNMHPQRIESGTEDSDARPAPKSRFQTTLSWFTGILACLCFLSFTQYCWEAIVAVALFALWGIADLIRRRRARGHDE